MTLWQGAAAALFNGRQALLVTDVGPIFPERLECEVSASVTHAIRYTADEPDRVPDAKEAIGYGLTLGVHTRIEAVVAQIHERFGVGNIYIDRNVMAAVAGGPLFASLRH